ncbi:MAG: hypothetical protein RL499_734, partial [Actinomycetota bacterium]
RVFYAIDDTRTAFWLQAAHTLFFIIGAAFCSFLPTAWIVPGIGLVTSAAAFFQMIIGGFALRRRIGSLDAALIARRTSQFIIAGLAALLVGVLIGWSLGTLGEAGFARDTVGGAAASVALIGVPMVAVYGAVLLAMRVPDAMNAVALVRRRLQR